LTANVVVLTKLGQPLFFGFNKTGLISKKNGGGDGDRTHDPFHAMEVLSQLSYAPNLLDNPGLKPREQL
jgi:hypothetical protein